MRSLTAAAAAAAVLLSGVDAGPVVQVDMYRAMRQQDVDKNLDENDNLADLLGVLKYLHTECIAEHELTDSRTTRKYGIDSITVRRFKVRNPDAMTAPDSTTCQLQDFGPFVTFDYGQSTNPDNDETIAKFGDYVGVQEQQDPRIPLALVNVQPYFWFSISGFCPNLPWTCTDGYGGGCHHDPPIFTSRCDPQHPCPGKGPKDDPVSQCKEYDDDYRSILGGLCPGGNNTLNEPTGEHGCAYTYDQPSTTNMDEVVGIRTEDCGGRMCTDWYDFRMHCSNPDYKKKYDSNSLQIVDVSYCVEYDIHPSCAADCGSKDCMDVEEDKRELGIPFWRGRCDTQKTLVRLETLAAAFKVEGASDAHQVLHKELRPSESKLACSAQQRPDASLRCTPITPNGGGPFCARDWAAVCVVCQIPNTTGVNPSQDKPWCPLDILQSVDYAPPFSAPSCRSKKAADRCCLYMGNCEGDKDPSKAKLDDNGYILIAAERDTEKMKTFLMRLVDSLNWKVTDESGFHQYAYWQWSNMPMNRTLGTAKELMKDYVDDGSGGGGSGDGGGAGWIVVVVVIFVIAAAVGGLIFIKNKKKQEVAARNLALLHGAGGGAQMEQGA